MTGAGGSATAEGLEETLKRALELGDASGRVVELSTERDGRRWEVRLVPAARDTAGATVILAIAREVTLTGSKEGETFARRDELTELGHALFHDLKGPLATMRTFLGFLTVDLKERDEARIATDIGSIQSAVERMGEVLTDIVQKTRA